RFFGRPAPEFCKQPSPTCGKHRDAFRIDSLATRVVHEHIVHALEADRLMPQDLRYEIGAFEYIATANHNQQALGGTGYKPASDLESGHTGSLGTNQCPSNMEAILRKQVVQVIAGNAARDVRIFLTHELAVLIANATQPSVDLCLPPPRDDDAVEFSLAGLADLEPNSIVGKDFEFLDVLVRLPRHDRMHTAGVVADHPSQGATAVARGIGAESQVVLFGSRPQMVENDPGLDSGNPPLGIELENTCHVLGKIKHDRDVAALTCQGCSAAAAE